jgi:putative two-component system response regulator
VEHAGKKVVLVDDMTTNLKIGSKILRDEYEVFTVPSGEKLFLLLGKVTPDVILLDVDMPVMNGHEVLRRLRANGRTRDIPVIFLSGSRGPSSEAEGLSLGAVDYVAKPYSPQLLRRRVDMQIRLQTQEKKLRDYEEQLQLLRQDRDKALADMKKNILMTVIELVERRDEVTGGHVERTRRDVDVLFDVLVRNNLYTDIVQTWERDFLLQSTLLYDLGKVSIHDEILLKPGKLTDAERAEMKKHTFLGVRILEDIETELRKNASGGFFDHAKAFAGSHHEHWDGTGYPYGLKGYNIPLEGRIIAIADVYAALVAERPYHTAYSHEEAMAIIAREKGAHFDPALVDLFLSVSDQFRKVPDEPPRA